MTSNFYKTLKIHQKNKKNETKYLKIIFLSQIKSGQKSKNTVGIK